MSKPKLVAHVLVAKDLCPGPLLPLEICKYYRDVLSTGGALEHDGMKAVKANSEATLFFMDHKSNRRIRGKTAMLPLEDGPLHDEDPRSEPDGG